jgi:outer membrane murein-binding lipoprotein Lpp
MKQAAKATALVLAVSLLSGCSSSEAKACEAATKAYSELKVESQELAKSIKILNEGSLYFEAKDKREMQIFTVKQAMMVMINNQKCFTPKEVSAGQILLKELENLK